MMIGYGPTELKKFLDEERAKTKKMIELLSSLYTRKKPLELKDLSDLKGSALLVSMEI